MSARVEQAPEVASLWSVRELVDLLASVWADLDEEEALAVTVARCVEILGAEVAAVVADGRVAAVAGAAAGADDGDLLAVADGRKGIVELPWAGVSQAVSVAVEDERPGRLLIVRKQPLGPQELDLLRGLARVLSISLRMHRTLAQVRAQAEENERLAERLRHRQALLERLTRIERAITHGADRQTVLDMIAQGASELVGDEAAGLGLLHPDDSERARVVAAVGIAPELLDPLLQGPAGSSLGGRAMEQGRLVAVDEDEREGAAELTEQGLRAAMAAPVHEKGRVIGSLVVATARRGRRYSEAERETLLAFAEHASLALSDARTVEDAVFRSVHDPLTELPNRLLFQDRLDHALALAERSGRPVAVLFLDLDGFKRVNDSLGHAAGDELLVAVAGRLRRSVRPADTVARLGGDEFAILIEELPPDVQAGSAAERILGELAEPFVIRSRSVVLGASVGVAVGTSRRDDLVHAADLAMYRAKEEGKGRVQVFQPEMRAAVTQRLDLEVDLRRALDHERLEVYFQPVVRIADGSIVGFEALARWCHPRRGWVSPAEFVPLAEETGLILPLGEWVLREACRFAASWPRSRPELWLSVNLSAAQLEHPDLVEMVRTTLDASALEPERLWLEITETVLMRDAEEAVAQLARLKSLGIGLSIDDFGTGHWSLRHLERLPLDGLKIAKVFVDGLLDPERDPVVVRAVLDLGASFSLQVIAEGVERLDQARRLQELGCALGQGYLFARPASGRRAL
ncbi:MAG: hypothetical protein C4305_05515, partial [Thermoleophilia bacterium]